MARELRAAGFDSGLAPVLDCRVESASAVIGDRAFAADPAAVAACGVASVRAMLAGGLLPVAKHFPGHGREAVDSHHELPDVGATPDDPERTQPVPFPAAPRAGRPALPSPPARFFAP